MSRVALIGENSVEHVDKLLDIESTLYESDIQGKNYQKYFNYF